MALVAGTDSGGKCVRRTGTCPSGEERRQCLFSHRKLMSYHQKMCEEHGCIMNDGRLIMDARGGGSEG